MTDQRQHRGPHPKDQQLFADDQAPRLRQATSDLSWLFSRGYVAPSALKLVGDRYSLVARQRTAIIRCACSDAAHTRRRANRIDPDDVTGEVIWIDGFNVLTTVEAALSSGVILRARDGTYRDMASMHGSYRRVQETYEAIELTGKTLASLEIAHAHWLLDAPVSNSGRLKTQLRAVAERHDWNWQIELVADPDQVLSGLTELVATSDSQILDRTTRWLNHARLIVDRSVPDPWIVDLSP